MGPKIKRDAGFASLFRSSESVIRLTQSLPDPAPGYLAKFGRSRWQRLDEFDEIEIGEGERYQLRHRFTSACIEHEGEVVGAVKLIEYDIPPIWVSWFWEAMDSYDSATHELSEVLLCAWADFAFDVACYGRVLELNRLWVSPQHSRQGIWIPVVNELFKRVNRQTAIVIAKAYPLEYEGKLPEGAPERPAFERRRLAMIRYYGRHLDLRPLPGDSGRRGWIWKPRLGLEGIIDPPTFSEEWQDEL